MNWLLFCCFIILLQFDTRPVLIFARVNNSCPCCPSSSIFLHPNPPDPPVPPIPYKKPKCPPCQCPSGSMEDCPPCSSDDCLPFDLENCPPNPSPDCPPNPPPDCPPNPPPDCPPNPSPDCPPNPSPDCPPNPSPDCPPNPSPDCPPNLPPDCPPNPPKDCPPNPSPNNFPSNNHPPNNYPPNYPPNNYPPNYPPNNYPPNYPSYNYPPHYPPYYQQPYPSNYPPPNCPPCHCPAANCPPCNCLPCNCPAANCPPAPPPNCPPVTPPNCSPASPQNCPPAPPPNCPPAPAPNCPVVNCPPASPPNCPAADCPPAPVPNCPAADCPPAPSPNCPSADCPPPPNCTAADCPPAPVPNCPPAQLPNCPSADCPPAPNCTAADCPSAPTCPAADCPPAAPSSCPQAPPSTFPTPTTPEPSSPPPSCPPPPPNPPPKTPNAMLTLFFKNVYLSDSKLPSATSTNQITESMETLTARQTIKDVALMENPNITFPDEEKWINLFKSDKNDMMDNILIGDKVNKDLLTKVVDSISRILNFYDAQMHQTAITGLMFLKGIDEKHGNLFQKQFPLKDWIHEACERMKTNSIPLSNLCHSMTSKWKSRSGPFSNTSVKYWKDAEILQKELDEVDQKLLENIGNEQEEIWSSLNIQCHKAVGDCKLPLACERVFLDPTPRSQYLLSHQVFMRMFIDSVNCPSLKSFVSDDGSYTKLCSKMYMEAKYLDVLNIPVIHRDLFAELIGFCGYLGYTNFFRQDWLESMLSWQSKSDIGCFIKDSTFPSDVITNDMGFMRRATRAEEEKEFKPQEKCLPHLTVTNLIALSAYWDYVMDNLENKSD